MGLGILLLVAAVVVLASLQQGADLRTSSTRIMRNGRPSGDNGYWQSFGGLLALSARSPMVIMIEGIMAISWQGGNLALGWTLNERSCTSVMPAGVSSRLCRSLWYAPRSVLEDW